MKTPLALIGMFRSVIRDDSRSVDFYHVNTQATKNGWFVTLGACNQDALDFIDSLSVDYNSTFYKKWMDIMERDRFELLLDQLRHYATTYGTDFRYGNGYVPNDGEIVLNVQEFSTYKVIDVCSEKEMYEKCIGLLQSGMALGKSTLDAVCGFVIDWVRANSTEKEFQTGDFETVTNKEAVTRFCDVLGFIPTKKFDLLRYIIFHTTGSSVIIQNNDMVFRITYSDSPFDFTRLTESQIVSLSSIFRRFKKLFLAFKHNTKVSDSSRRVINRLGRLAVKNHTPLVPGFWESLTDRKPDLNEVNDRLSEVNSFKLIQIVNSLLRKWGHYDEETHPVYKIRNGSMFTDLNSSVSEPDEYEIGLGQLLTTELIRRVDSNTVGKYRYVRYGDVNVACPESDKNFVGNLPFGSYVTLDKGNFIGIYWRNEWGAHDLDLHLVDSYFQHMGWNSRFKADGIVYSGDMTNANPEASEIFYFSDDAPDGAIYVHLFHGNHDSEYRLFAGTENLDGKIHRNYMVNPDSVKMNVMCRFDDKVEMVGVTYKGRFYMMSLNSGNGIPSGTSEIKNETFRSLCVDASHRLMIKNLINLPDILTLTPEELDGVNPDEILDLSDCPKDRLISLFAAGDRQ